MREKEKRMPDKELEREREIPGAIMSRGGREGVGAEGKRTVAARKNVFL